MENLRIVPLTVMFTVTAPGADVFPFDPRFCVHSPSQKCSGRLGCRVSPDAAEAFNNIAGKWWSQLHRAAKLRVDRCSGHRGKLPTRVWEKQRRGLVHVHGVLSVATPTECAWSRAYVTALREMAPRYGFGFVDGWHKIGRKFWPGTQAAGYLSSYFVRGRGRKADITKTVKAGDMPRLVVFVSRDLTMQTGCTMRALRNARRLWAAREGFIEAPRLTYEMWLAAAAMLQRSDWPHSPAP